MSPGAIRMRSDSHHLRAHCQRRLAAKNAPASSARKLPGTIKMRSDSHHLRAHCQRRLAAKEMTPDVVTATIGGHFCSVLVSNICWLTSLSTVCVRSFPLTKFELLPKHSFLFLFHLYINGRFYVIALGKDLFGPRLGSGFSRVWLSCCDYLTSGNGFLQDGIFHKKVGRKWYKIENPKLSLKKR